MRQVQDTLIWLAMIMVVAGVIYAMPRVANLVAEARSEHGPDCVTCGNKVNVSHHQEFSHRHDR
jgi:hypothetical protein